MDFSAVIIVLVGSVLALSATRGLDRREGGYAMAAFGAHVLMSAVHWLITEFFYGVSDAHGYQFDGIQLAKLVEFDPVRFVPEVVKLALHIDPNIPFAIGDGSSTGTMSAIAGVFILLAGPSLLSMNLLTGGFCWFGQLCLYRVAREELPIAERGAAALGLMWVPSVIFWGSGFVKEAFSLGFFGILAWSTYSLFRHRNVLSLAGVVVGGVGVAMTKSFTLFAFVLGAAAFVYADRSWRSGGPIRVRPGYLLLTVALAVGGIAAMGSVFPEYSAAKVADTIASHQEAGQVDAAQGVNGGSSVDIGSGDAKTLPEQLVFVPFAFVNTFLRPAIFEVKNGPMLGAAVENSVLMVVLVSILGGAMRRVVREAVFRTPFLTFSVVFMLVFGAGVGLATSNLGTLSRYRMPMMPFYVTVVLVLRRRAKEATFAARVQPVPLVVSRARSRVA